MRPVVRAGPAALADPGAGAAPVAPQAGSGRRLAQMVLAAMAGLVAAAGLAAMVVTGSPVHPARRHRRRAAVAAVGVTRATAAQVVGAEQRVRPAVAVRRQAGQVPVAPGVPVETQVRPVMAAPVLPGMPSAASAGPAAQGVIRAGQARVGLAARQVPVAADRQADRVPVA